MCTCIDVSIYVYVHLQSHYLLTGLRPTDTPEFEFEFPAVTVVVVVTVAGPVVVAGLHLVRAFCNMRPIAPYNTYANTYI